jgi:ABC-type transport system substrate-binding protein
MQKVLIPLVILLAVAFIISGCGGGTTTTAPATTAAQPPATSALPIVTGVPNPPTTAVTVPTTAPPAPATSAAPAPSTAAPSPSAAPTTTAAAGQPVRGGILREIETSGPLVLSYYPEMGPGEENGVQPAEEQLMQFGQDHIPHPRLAESMTVAPDNKSVTFKLRKGIKFTDGSDFNATAVAWNYQRAYDSGKLQFKSRVTGFKVVDDYTFEVDITAYDNQMQYELGWVPIFSKVAWDNAGSDNATRAAWARNNIVATGPFILKEYKKDDHMTWVRNPNYWQPGKPYLDGIEIKFIPDPVTATTMMQAKQADFWEGGSVIQWKALEKQGFKLQGSSGTPITIYINEKDSKFTDQRLREAVEYALDKKTMANALGQGIYTPLENSIGPDMWGYDPNYKGRQYDTAKAKQLLADAGYPNGLKITLTSLTGPFWTDQATALKQYLDQVGFQTNIDQADPGRFFPMYWKLGPSGGWPDLLLFLQASSPNTYVAMNRTFGPEPKTVIWDYVEPPDLTAYFIQSRTLFTIPEQQQAAATIAGYFAKDALVVPTWETPSLYVIAPYVHTTYQFESVICRYTENEWMDPH